MHKETLIILLLFFFGLVKINVAQEDVGMNQVELKNKNHESVAFGIHGVGYQTKYMTALYLGMQVNSSFNSKKWMRLGFAMNMSKQDTWNQGGGTVNGITLGGGILFPLRKNRFLFQPGIHVVYMKQDFDKVGGGYVRFNGAGLKGITNVALGVGNFDIGFHIDLSIGVGYAYENTYTLFPERNFYFSFIDNAGLFIQYNLKK